MRPLAAMIAANIKMSLRNRTALFWNLAFPAIFILIFGVVFDRDTGVSVSVGLAGEASPFRQAAESALRDAEAFRVETGETAAELAALEDGERDVVLIFAPARGAARPEVELAYDETGGPNTQIAIGAVRQVLLDVAGGESPVAITTRGIRAREISFIDFFVPGILAMSLMNSGVIGFSTAFVTYRERGILRRIKVTPFPLWSFILARVLSQLIVAVAQALILIGLAALVFGLRPSGNPLLILAVLVLGALTFLALGFAIAAIARTTETAASYANLVTFPMLFLSGVFFSVENAPGWLQPLTRLLPLRYLVDALRGPMTQSAGLSQIWLDLLILVATFAVAMAFALRFFRWDVTE
ncbi:MAG: ABC transporter permease [Chloroflexota bacterium]|nr:ABC transporter permease [Chloroflexota bacterium]